VTWDAEKKLSHLMSEKCAKTKRNGRAALLRLTEQKLAVGKSDPFWSPSTQSIRINTVRARKGTAKEWGGGKEQNTGHDLCLMK